MVHPWVRMDTYANGYPCVSMGTHRYTWVPIGTHRYFWASHLCPCIPMGTHQYQWVPLGTHEYLRVPTETQWYLWVPLGTHGYLCLPSVTHSFFLRSGFVPFSAPFGPTIDPLVAADGRGYILSSSLPLAWVILVQKTLSFWHFSK